MKIIVTLTKHTEKVVYDSVMNETINHEEKKLACDELKAFHKYASIIVLVLMGILAVWLFRQLAAPRMDFYNELWGPASLLVQGKSPYDTSSLNTNLSAAWFPMAIGFFFPLGWLPESAALQVWFIFNIIELCAIIYIVQGDDRSAYNTGILVLLCLFFPPTLNHFSLGQISITVTLCLVLAVHFANKERHWLSAFCVALAFSKPHLALLAGLGLSYRHYLHGKARGMISFWARTLIMSLALCLPLFIAHPNWIPDAILSMKQNPFWLYPSLFILFQRYFDAWGHIMWGATSIFTIWLCYLLWRRLPPANAMVWSLALVPLLSPYVGSWDFVVLLPLLILTFVKINRVRKVFLIILYAAAWYGMALVQMQVSSHNHFFWWVPLWFLGMSAFMTNWKTDNLSGCAQRV